MSDALRGMELGLGLTHWGLGLGNGIWIKTQRNKVAFGKRNVRRLLFGYWVLCTGLDLGVV